MLKFNTSARMFLASAAIAALPVMGSAATFDVLQQRASATDDGTGDKSVMGHISVPDGLGGQDVTRALAGSFHLKKRPTDSGDPYADFIAFCFEVAATLTTSPTSVTTYESDPAALDSGRRSLMATLLGTGFDPALGADHHAATQIAVWKLATGDISSPSGDAFDVTARSSAGLTSGFFSVAEADVTEPTFDENSNGSPGVFTLAQQLLDNLDGDATNGEWTLLSDAGLMVLTAAGTQNLVTYTPGPGPITPPIPLPAPALLLIGGLASLGLLRRTHL